jgi:hypothetical protein
MAMAAGAGNCTGGGATGPTAPMPPGGFANASAPRKVSIDDIKPTIHQHRRLYNGDLSLLASYRPELINGFIQNRLMVALPADAFGPLGTMDWITKYESWLDMNLSAHYHIEVSSTDDGFVVSFELEGDMMQFVLAFR